MQTHTHRALTQHKLNVSHTGLKMPSAVKSIITHTHTCTSKYRQENGRCFVLLFLVMGILSGQHTSLSVLFKNSIATYPAFVLIPNPLFPSTNLYLSLSLLHCITHQASFKMESKGKTKLHFLYAATVLS